MKIGINTLSIVPGSMGAAETYMYNLFKKLAEIDHLNEYIVFVSKNNQEHFVTSNQSFHPVLVPGEMSNRLLRIAIEHMWLPYLARQRGIDVLFCPSDSLPIGVNCKTVVTVQNLIYFHFHNFYRGLSSPLRSWARVWSQYAYYRAITPRSLRRATRVVTVSHNAATEIINYTRVPSEKVRVVYYGVADVFKPWTPQKKREFRTVYPWIPESFILYVGALSPYKNLDRLVEAFSVLKKKYTVPYKLVLVGGDPIGLGIRLRVLAESLGLGDDIIIRPYMSHYYMPGLYNLASCLCLLSSCESFGLPLAEAMACGIPVVAAKRSSLPEIVGDGGLLVDPDDIEEVADALYQVITHTALASNLTERGRVQVQRFSWQGAAQQMMMIFEEIANY